MVITDGYVVAQADSNLTCPIAQFPTLQEAADWLIAIYTRDGDTEPLPQYDPSLYVVERWSDGNKTMNRWQVEADGTTVPLS